MSDARYLTRLTLRRDVPASALRAVLLPRLDEERTLLTHKLIWTLFADSPTRMRDFLWRDAGQGRFYTLSERPPEDAHGLFDVDEPKEFTPELRAGDRLRFALRANATVARKTAGAKRGKPSDVVMDALFKVPKGPERAAARSDAVQAAGLDWLARQGERSGFSLLKQVEGEGNGARVTSYQALRVDPKRGMTIGVLDYEGELEIRDPLVFLNSLRDGFGRAKAFGCGLMMVRRA
ncbi:type I-E CRISPR-associated protein Cas6/Cse3/CasE [soil metagenome]